MVDASVWVWSDTHTRRVTQHGTRCLHPVLALLQGNIAHARHVWTLNTAQPGRARPQHAAAKYAMSVMHLYTATGTQYPPVGLVLGVHHEGPALATRDKDAVVN